ncbi:MAG: hypothetical protein M1826_001833 [Phylliscum demangeonii]|nr:MAG: hypothetical protein M1826_001833 [Phylliscum demangeonii]
MRTLVSSAKKQPLFTVSLPLGRYSYINLGQIDHSRYAGELIHTETFPRARGVWAVTAFAVSVGSSRGHQPAVSFDTSEKISMFDTGSSGMVLPEPVVRAYMSQVPGGASSPDPVNDEIHVRCDAKLPDLHLHLHPASGSRSGSGSGRSGIATVPGAMLLGDRVLLDPRHCCLRMQSAGHSDYQLFGLPLFNSHFVVFDFHAGISLALHAAK